MRKGPVVFTIQKHILKRLDCAMKFVSKKSYTTKDRRVGIVTIQVITQLVSKIYFWQSQGCP
jgi:hypothetical protein